MLDMAYGRLRTPAPTMAVTLWKVEYHHLAVLEDVIGSQSSIALSSSVLWSHSPSLAGIPHIQHKNGKSRFLSSKSSFKNEQLAMLSNFNMYSSYLVLHLEYYMDTRKVASIHSNLPRFWEIFSSLSLILFFRFGKLNQNRVKFTSLPKINDNLCNAKDERASMSLTNLRKQYIFIAMVYLKRRNTRRHSEQISNKLGIIAIERQPLNNLHCELLVHNQKSYIHKLDTTFLSPKSNLGS